eukprot:312539_1
MMVSSSEGRHEIEAAKLRLAAAKSQTIVATKMLTSAEAAEESAKKTSAITPKSTRDARDQVGSCKKEMEEAEKYLKETEERWEVIDIDEERLDSLEKKRRRANTRASPARAATTMQPGVIRTVLNCNDNYGQANEICSTPDVIVVEGSGSSDVVNGPYKKSRRPHNGHPCYYKLRELRKKYGSSTVVPKCFGVLARMDILIARRCFFTQLETSPASKYGWSVQRNGIAPAPRLNWYCR